MKGLRAGLGLVFGAALGLVFGLILFDDWWVGPMIGVVVGLVIGAVADLLGPGDGAGRASDSDMQ